MEERSGGGRVRSRDSGPVGSEVGRGRCSPGGPGSRPWLVCLGTLLGERHPCGGATRAERRKGHNTGHPLPSGSLASSVSLCAGVRVGARSESRILFV